ncbi:MAG: MBL fold metallo-hydrolase [Candidatus Desulfaltia sp.]|nr:MBL fold metallo-hydrolase [Candidatus Desulfaltia sp.]
MITKTQKLSGDRTIHQFRGRTSNIYIIEDKRQNATFLIDCGMPSDMESLFNVLKPLPVLRRIVCTHFHVDHVAGWISLKKVFKNCEIWLHEKAKPFVVGRKRIPYPSFGDYIKILLPCMKEYGYYPKFGDLFNGGFYGTPFKKGFPLDRVEFFANEQKVLPGFITIQTPGHRPCSVSFFDPDSGILVSGDFIVVIQDKLVNNSFVASRQDQENSIYKIKQIKGVKFIYPGHGYCRPFDVDKL